MIPLRKRDYQPSLFYQQAWWEEYRQFNDYFARLSTCFQIQLPEYMTMESVLINIETHQYIDRFPEYLLVKNLLNQLLVLLLRNVHDICHQALLQAHLRSHLAARFHHSTMPCFFPSSIPVRIQLIHSTLKYSVTIPFQVCIK